VERQVELAVEGLDADADPDVEPPGAEHALDQLGRDRLAGREVAREARQDRWLPGPVLHDLGRRLDEVPLGLGGAEARVLRAGEAHVQDVAELVEERLDLAVLEQRGRSADGGVKFATIASPAPRRCRRGTVADDEGKAAAWPNLPGRG
jgi:hypothetical protein